jgi:hypothetical protein
VSAAPNSVDLSPHFTRKSLCVGGGGGGAGRGESGLVGGV